MIIDKGHVLQALRSYGLTEQAARAARELDAQVDTQRDADTLRALGLDPEARAQGGALAVRRDPPANDR